MQNTYFPYLVQLLIALVLTSLTVLTHFGGMNWVKRYYLRFSSRSKQHDLRGLVMVGTVAIMMVTHVMEITIWAIFYYMMGITPDWYSSVHASILHYTTLGETTAPLPEHWRGIGGFEAMNAMLMFGWSTAMLAAVLFKLNVLDELSKD
ncbi:MAG TPA: hypothetical protein VFF53_00010 [Geobacteraceae bacterium]|nr:hypothetical protein [Geobacteraceae bacterium]